MSPGCQVSVSLSVLVLLEVWDSQGNLGRLGRARMSPFKEPASGSWSTWQLLQLVTNHKTKEPAQGRMLGGPMRGKGGDLGKGRVLGSYKILRPPPHSPPPHVHLVFGGLSLYFLSAFVFAVSRAVRPTDHTLIPPDSHPSPTP